LTTYQLFPDLTDEEYQALKDSIAQYGVLVPIDVDDEGNILDGHHRVRAWNELKAEGVKVGDYPRIVRGNMSEEQKRNHVRTVNMMRRHLSEEQRNRILADMQRDGMSTRVAARVAGVSNFTAYQARVRYLTPEECPTISVLRAAGKKNTQSPRAIAL